MSARRALLGPRVITAAAILLCTAHPRFAAANATPPPQSAAMTLGFTHGEQPAQGCASRTASDSGSSLLMSEAAGFDYAKCIESCDKQYSDCTKNGDAERIKYCSNQHDKCRKACLEHKG